ncbi:ATP-binding protein [Actinomadura craniellae]|uniref:ATP-binding protein n=1 Tax=Actinomadura craniellae TaxID=2231787 RepID=A0A365H4S5_9ACTN|nr:ATP-binding protein [Actinomadura craniellae]RAY13223.1 ATP-binding protein [Actinomadura craniellae]
MTTTAESAAPPHFTQQFLAYNENVRLVRSLMDRAADAWGLPEDLRDAGRLALTELASNAVRTCPGRRIDARVALSGDGTVTVSVRDPDASRMPEPTSAGPEDLHGRGLAIVAALACGRYGWHPHRDGGKVVWAALGPR